MGAALRGFAWPTALTCPAPTAIGWLGRQIFTHLSFVSVVGSDELWSGPDKLLSLHCARIRFASGVRDKRTRDGGSRRVSPAVGPVSGCVVRCVLDPSGRRGLRL